MRKKTATIMITGCLAAIITVGMNTVVFAGQWCTDDNGMWYQHDDGTYTKNGWGWIDSNRDGMEESYCFDANGYLLTNMTTPDGYAVNSSGQWVENGVVQLRPVTNDATEDNEFKYASFVEGFEKAEFEKFNSPASENGLGGTDIYIDATLDRVEAIASQQTLIGYFTDDGGNNWVCIMHAVEIVGNNYYDDVVGQQVIARGDYGGYSGTKKCPTMHLDRLVVKDNDREYLGLLKLTE